ncbi:MAG: hypothetical protein WC521_01070 [Bdellovibrionales bacterium]
MQSRTAYYLLFKAFFMGFLWRTYNEPKTAIHKIEDAVIRPVASAVAVTFSTAASAVTGWDGGIVGLRLYTCPSEPLYLIFQFPTELSFKSIAQMITLPEPMVGSLCASIPNSLFLQVGGLGAVLAGIVGTLAGYYIFRPVINNKINAWVNPSRPEKDRSVEYRKALPNGRVIDAPEPGGSRRRSR